MGEQAERSAFERLGGEPVLRAIIDRLIDQVFDDIMIGFHFRAASRERVKEKEYEFAARHLGGPGRYTGRALREAHEPHPILDGQFNRRLRILEETLDEFAVEPSVREAWLAHSRALRPLVIRGSCASPPPAARTLSSAEEAGAGPDAPVPRLDATDSRLEAPAT